MDKFCKRCRKETKHRKLRKAGFLAQCVAAAVTGFSVDLREPDYECNTCGLESND
jgi:hypothetical protein